MVDSLGETGDGGGKLLLLLRALEVRVRAETGLERQSIHRWLGSTPCLRPRVFTHGTGGSEVEAEVWCQLLTTIAKLTARLALGGGSVAAGLAGLETSQ